MTDGQTDGRAIAYTVIIRAIALCCRAQKCLKMLSKYRECRFRCHVHVMEDCSRSWHRNGKSYRFHIWPVYSEGPSEQKPIKKFREKGAWAYPGTANFLGGTIISGTGKATDFKFGQYIQRVHLNKSPLKILEKRERGRIQDSRDCPIFRVSPIISGTGKATKFKFCMHIYRLNRNKISWASVTDPGFS